MPVITAIKAQKNQKRVNIFLDGEFSFGLDLENFMKLQLKVNQELSREQIKVITDEGEKAKAIEKVLTFASTRPHSKKEILDYLKRKRINVLIHSHIFEKLEKYGLIDDFIFAKWWVEQRLAFKLKSKKDISFELKQKGIDTNVIKNILDDSEIDEIKIAKELIIKKSYKWQRFDEKTRRQKVYQYLVGKGFGWNIINSVVDIDPK